MVSVTLKRSNNYEEKNIHTDVFFLLISSQYCTCQCLPQCGGIDGENDAKRKNLSADYDGFSYMG